MKNRYFLVVLLWAGVVAILQSINFAAAGLPGGNAEEVTYAKHIHPIITKYCTPCHRPDQITPFSLLGYGDVKMRARFIAQVINQKIMPPWPADTSYSRFANEKILTAGEIELINAWIKNGMPPGDTSRIKQHEALTKSIVRKPDYVFSVPEKLMVLPKETDQYVRLRVKSDMDKDIIAEGFAFIPGNVHAVHHAELLSHAPDTLVKTKMSDTLDMQVTYSYEGSFFRGYQYVTGWLPGTTIESFPPGVVKKLSAADDYIFLLHFPPSLMLEVDSSVLYVYEAKKADRFLETIDLHGTYHLVNGPLVIPGNTVKTFHATRTVEKDMSAFAVLPHAHHLCRKMEAYAVTPAADTIPLLRINDWQFNWQFLYKFPRYVKLPAGTTIHFFATYDNTANNPENPYNPPREVRSSFNANDEMMELFIFSVEYREGDEKQEIKYELP